jgi:curved DNA-binding protein CbpA
VETFDLLPSLAAGDLAETSALELVAAVYRSRASGTLWVEAAQASEIRIFFRSGEMCGSGFFSGFRTLAHVLLENEWVDAIEIDSSREEAEKSKKRHGEVLVARGLLTHEQLNTALGAQHQANLAALLALTAGKYDWRGWEPPPPWAREIVVDPVACLIDALEHQKHASRRQRVIDWLGDHAARLTLDWPEMQGKVSLSAADRRATALLSKPRTLRDFVQVSGLPSKRAEAVLASLLLCGGAEPVVAGARSQAAPVDEEPPAAEILEEPEPVTRRPRRASVDEKEAIARLDSLDLSEPHPIAPPPAAAEEPLELDLSGRAQASPPPGGNKAPPERAENAFADSAERSRELRKKMVARGIRNLGTAPQQREEAVPAAKFASRSAVDESKLSDEELRLVDDVRSRLRLMSGQNAYGRLGVSPSASPETIRSAYLEAAKRYHPDRAAGALSGLQADLQAVFTVLKEAWESLASSEQRADYDEQLKSTGLPRAASRREEATLSLKMGEALLKKRDFEGAINKLRRSIDLEATGDALAALSWALVSDPKATAQVKEEAASLINRALRAPGVTARTYYVAGVLWRTKDPDSAVDAFRKALEMDPNHSDAALELRLIEQRRGKPQKSGGGVLSGLFSGKRKPS